LFTGAPELPASQPRELDLQPLDLQLLCLKARAMLEHQALEMIYVVG
jgi:hypothetical protein